MKAILVTGSTDGIGLETALELASRGHTVVLHGRNEEKVRRARNAIQRAASDAVLHTAHANLTDPAAVALMAQHLAVARTPPAGCIPTRGRPHCPWQWGNLRAIV